MGLLTPKQAAAELAISSRQLRDLSLDGDIPFINVGRGERPARRYEITDIEAFKAERRTISSRPLRPAKTYEKTIDFEAVIAARQKEKKVESEKKAQVRKAARSHRSRLSPTPS